MFIIRAGFRLVDATIAGRSRKPVASDVQNGRICLVMASDVLGYLDVLRARERLGYVARYPYAYYPSLRQGDSGGVV